MTQETIIAEKTKSVAANQVSEMIQLEKHSEEEYNIGTFNKKPVYSFFKRFFDLFLSIIALIVLFLPMVVIGIVIKCNSKGPVLYKQTRLGRNNKSFYIYKFRSMYLGAEKNGAQWATKNDPRITSVGKAIRYTRLDELPQLWNIIKGDMSIVGPRPEREIFTAEIEKYIPTFRQRLLVKPGLTGLSQINGQYELTPEEKMAFDVEYIQKRNLLFDAKCIVLTIPVMITHKGAR